MTYKLVKEDDYSITVDLKFQNGKYYPRIGIIKNRKRQAKQLKYTFDTIEEFENSELLKSLKNNNDLLKTYFNTPEKIKPVIVTKDNKSRLIYFKNMLNDTERRSKRRNFEFNITLYDLDLLYKLNKNCAISNIPLLLKTKSLQSISLDRIKNDKGYIKGNIQFVCKGINLMKNTHTNEEAINFLNLIK